MAQGVGFNFDVNDKTDSYFGKAEVQEHQECWVEREKDILGKHLQPS